MHKTRWAIIGALTGLIIGSAVGMNVGPITELPMALAIGFVVGLLPAVFTFELGFAGPYGCILLIVGPILGAVIAAISRPIDSVIAGVVCGLVSGAVISLMIRNRMRQQVATDNEEKARGIILILAASFWLFDMWFLYWVSSLSILAFVFLSLFYAAGVSVAITKVDFELSVFWAGVSLLNISLSYWEHIHPIGIKYVRDWWIPSVVLVTVCTFRIIQYAIRRILQPR